MTRFRTNPPREIGGTPVHLLKDFELLVQTNLLTGETIAIDQKTTSNVLQFFTTGGTKISIRPSGTEPKIKFYFEVHDTLKSYEDLDFLESSIDARIDAMVAELGL